MNFVNTRIILNKIDIFKNREEEWGSWIAFQVRAFAFIPDYSNWGEGIPFSFFSRFKQRNEWMWTLEGWQGNASASGVCRRWARKATVGESDGLLVRHAIEWMEMSPREPRAAEVSDVVSHHHLPYFTAPINLALVSSLSGIYFLLLVF
ncbi:hypothetical protein HPP92_008378 [Vanilla planifolia]|uniref:Uncharacterized protein n=1 Tax=Vanilla planifolia TaxID=51239 RepID=A0A835R9J9_VANPL|nr:hypothetical protein HPP92_008378 [Vanilla planifolia]